MKLGDLFAGPNAPLENAWTNLQNASLAEFGALAEGVGAPLTVLSVLIGFLLTYQQLLHANRSLRIQAKNQSINRLTGLHERLYQLDKLDIQSRVDFEYHFYTRFAPAIEKRLVYQALLDQSEVRTLAEVNAILNFFEHVAYISTDGKNAADQQLFLEDSMSAFDFWFNVVIKKDTHAVLRRYLAYGYESISRRTRFDREPVYVATYGTLMSGQKNRLDKDVLARLQSRGGCKIPGSLYLIGPANRYPGLREQAPYDNAYAVGELFEIGADDDEARPILHVLDRYERYDIANPGASEYVRRYILVEEPQTDAWTPPAPRSWRLRPPPSRDDHRKRGAWVYFHKGDPSVDPMTPIPSGDWRTFSRTGEAS